MAEYETVLGGIASGMNPDCWDPNNGGTPLWGAIEDDRYDIAKKLLRLGSNPNCQADNGKSALMVAVERVIISFILLLEFALLGSESLKHIPTSVRSFD